MTTDPHACTCGTQTAHHDFRCPQNDASGNVCRAHFEQGRIKPLLNWEKAECADCQKAEQDQKDFIQKHYTIDPDQPYGQHIAITCELHPNAFWHTKNIDFIGARTIFPTKSSDNCTCERPRYTVAKED